MVTVTEPLPVPLAGVAFNPDAVHAHAALDAVTAITAEPPPSGALITDGLIANEQLVPNCVIEYTAPFTVMLPCRAVGAGLADTKKLTFPGPVPNAPAAMVIQLSLFVAVQLQPGPVATLKLAPENPDATLPAVGFTAYVHGGAGTTFTLMGTVSKRFAASGAATPTKPL